MHYTHDIIRTAIYSNKTTIKNYCDRFRGGQKASLQNQFFHLGHELLHPLLLVETSSSD